MQKYSIVGVANALLFNSNNQLLGEGILDTLNNSSIEITTSNTELRGGERNKLLDVYYHTPSGTATISNVKLNLDTIAANFGAAAPTFGTNIFKSENNITLTGQTGIVGSTPEKFKVTDSTAYGYLCYNGTTTRVEFIGKTFTAPSNIPANSIVMVTYYQYDANAEYIDIPASIIPERIRVVLTVALSTNETSKGIVGYTQFDIGVFQLAGSMTFNMTPDSFLTTDLTGMLLEDSEGGCTGVALETGGGRYAKITTILNNKNWYDDVKELAIANGDNFTMTTSSTRKLIVYAINNSGRSYAINNSDLTFACTPTTSVAVGANTGILTATATAGTGTVTVSITEKTETMTNCIVTVA